MHSLSGSQREAGLRPRAQILVLLAPCPLLARSVCCTDFKTSSKCCLSLGLSGWMVYVFLSPQARLETSGHMGCHR